MSLFQRLFGSAKPPETALQTLLARMTPEHAQTAYHSAKEPEMRLPAALSVLAMYVVHRFVVGYSQTVASTTKAAGVTMPSIPYDALAFEVAAYVHYWLLREYLHADIDGDEDSDDAQEPLFGHLRDSAQVSASLVYRYTAFPKADDPFMARVAAYLDDRLASETFVRAILAAQTRGAPGPVDMLDVSALPLSIATVSYVGIFHKSWLNGLSKSVQNLFAAHSAGLL